MARAAASRRPRRPPPRSRTSRLRTPLTTSGETATIEAIDADGIWGSITLTRGDDTGGFPHAPAGDGAFILEVRVEYEPERSPEGEFGVQDWALATAADRLPVGRIFNAPSPEDPSVPIEGQSMGRFPGAIDIFTTETDGLLYFEVPRSAAEEQLVLIYRPDGFDGAVTAIAIREPGEAPAPVPPATPAPTPAPLGYVEQPALPFTVIDSAEADHAFATPDTCTNPEAGYTVTFPDDWYTNTQIGNVPACSWFSPTFYEVPNPSVVPEEIAVTIGSFVSGVGFVHAPVYTVQDELAIAGWTANRTEELGGFGVDGYLPRSLFTYQYMIYADEDYLGLKVFGTTSNEMAGDYDLNKAILDRIMASLTFGDR